MDSDYLFTSLMVLEAALRRLSNTFGLALIVFSLAFLIGLFRFLRQRRRRFSLLRNTISSALIALVVGLVSYVTFWITGIGSAALGERPGRLIELRVDASSSKGTHTVTIKSSSDIPELTDFSVELTIESTESFGVIHVFRADLLGPDKSVLTFRGMSPCAAADAKADLISVCSAVFGDNRLSFAWLATPLKASRPKVTIESEQLKLLTDNQTRATIIRNGRPMQHYAYPDGRIWLPGQDRSNIAPVDDLLTVSSPTYDDDDFHYDTNKGLVELRPEIVTTLGMSREAYSWLSIVGSILAGMLGGGWLFYLLPSLKREPKPAEPPRSRADKPKPIRRIGPN
jgi:hypothetical protein